MATIVETVERDGHTINIYESGAEYNVTLKKLVKAPPSAMITKANAHIMKQKRQEKAARLLREAIVAETMDKLQVPAHGPAAAVAAAGGILWREIVLGEDVYPRDRLDAYMKLGAVAEIINTDKRQEPEKTTSAATDAATTALLNALREALTPRDVIDGTVTDTRNDKDG
jgi:hypothetical protein